MTRFRTVLISVAITSSAPAMAQVAPTAIAARAKPPSSAPVHRTPTRADVDPMPQPLHEVVVTRRDPCDQSPYDEPMQPVDGGPIAKRHGDLMLARAACHRRLVVRARFDIAPLFESSITR